MMHVTLVTQMLYYKLEPLRLGRNVEVVFFLNLEPETTIYKW